MATCKANVCSVFRPGLFDGKTAIVTGGGTGIGKAIAKELLYLGCQVVIASRKMDRLQEAAKEMVTMPTSTGRQPVVVVIQCNIRKEEEVRTMIQVTLKKFGKIDFMINNGGGQFLSAMENISLKGWNAVIETNLTGTFLCCKEVYRQWMKDNGGVIVNMLIDMWKGLTLMGHSGAARAGVDNITKTLALEWAASGVRVNAVCPGFVFSEFAAKNYGDIDFYKRATQYIPAKTLGTTEEISAAVCFLCSPAAAFISGTSIQIDGAQTLTGQARPFEIPMHSNLPAYTWEKDIQERNKSKL